MPSLSDDDLAELLRTFLRAYRERAHELEPDMAERSPILADPRIDVVLINGGRALHFVFSHESGVLTTIVRAHDMTLYPPSTEDLKAQADQDARQKERVRRTARIEGKVLAHLVVYPEDGAMESAMFQAGSRLAEEDMEGVRLRDAPRDRAP